MSTVYITAKDARAAGLRWRELERLVSDDEAVRLCRGWYALPLEPLPAEEDSPAERRRRLHGLVTRATVRGFAGRAVASHHSALVLASLPSSGPTSDGSMSPGPGMSSAERVIG